MLVKVCNQVVTPLPFSLQTTASKERRVIPVDSQDMRYLRFKAIGNFEVAGQNGNFDSFPYVWFEDERPGYGYKSFVNKRAHTEHNSVLGMAGSIGDLPDAYLNRFTLEGITLPSEFATIKNLRWDKLAGKKYADFRSQVLSAPHQKDGSIEVLMRIDTKLVKSATVEPKTKHLLERIIRMIDTGQRLSCSMGCNIKKSVCSTCGNTAEFAFQYCEHLKPTRKGGLTIVSANQIRDLLDKDLLRPEWLKHTVASKFDQEEIIKGASNKGIAVRNVEINHECSFFELSVVATPAYPDAIALEKLARKSDESKSDHMKRLASILTNEELLDVYDELKKRELVSSVCQVS
jgi:hypothetical protein